MKWFELNRRKNYVLTENEDSVDKESILVSNISLVRGKLDKKIEQKIVKEMLKEKNK